MDKYIEQLLYGMNCEHNFMLGCVDNMCKYTKFFMDEKSYVVTNPIETVKIYNKLVEKLKLYSSYCIINFEDFKLVLDSVVDIYNSSKSFEQYLDEDSLVNYIYRVVKNIKTYRLYLSSIDKYYSDSSVIELVNSNINMKSKYNNIINLYSGFGNLLQNLLNNNLLYNNIYCYDSDEVVNTICNTNISLSTNIPTKIKIINSGILNINNVEVKGDLILCDITKCNIKNIIYANCSEYIKKLKIRGTKLEPLILQLLLQIVNKDGEIVLVTPNSLLFGESNQHVETRKYLLDNFNIYKIIELENKNSIIFIKNNKNNQTIELIKNNKSHIISKDTINGTTYSLYFNNTILTTSPNNNVTTNNINNTKKLSELIDIYTSNDYKLMDENKLTKSVLYNHKFNNFNIEVINSDIDFNYIFVTKDESILKQDFLNIYLLELFTKKIDTIVKGKMQKVSPDLINDIEITLYSPEIQDQIISYINLNKDTIKNNNIQISNYNILKKQFIENMIYDCNNKVKLSEIFNVSNTCLDNSTLMIKKNSLDAGTVHIIDDVNKYNNNTNYYYLNIKDDKNYNYDYLYYMLHFLQLEFINQSLKNKSVGLSKTVLDNFYISILPEEHQKHLIYVAKHFIEQIELLEKNNKILEEYNLIKLL
jgi:hypothetical protein